MPYEDKYHLSPSESLFFSKKRWDENIYCGMKMENRAVTFPQTKTILDGVNVPDVQLDDIQAILNMRDAWRYLLNTVNVPVTLEYVCKLNEFIARNEALIWGKLRTGNVGISGTDYLPPIPNEEQVMHELDTILSSNTTVTEKALTAFLWCARSQLFWDGNKRTGLTLANKLMVSAGVGILTITDKYMEQFNTLLLEFYNTGAGDELKCFLYDHAIQGLEV